MQRITRDLCCPDGHDDRGGETDADECPVLPAVFHNFGTGRCGDVKIKERVLPGA